MTASGGAAGAVAVHGGRMGDAILTGLRMYLPDEDFVAAEGPESRERAEVLVMLADERSTLESVLHERIRWVHVLGAGVDRFPLDLVEGRVLSCGKGAASAAIAEFALACMLAFEKRLPDTWISEPPAEWNLAPLGGLDGRTLGLVGVGAIGSEVARRALAFDMEVLAVRRSGAPSPLAGVTVCGGLDEMLGRVDHLVLAAPATPATSHLLDDHTFAQVKPGLHLVNIARGSLVDQDALVRSLDDGRVAMASLDVVEPEPLPAGHPLFSHPGVRLSAHVSWASPRTGMRTFEIFADNLVRFRTGRELHGVVDPESGY